MLDTGVASVADGEASSPVPLPLAFARRCHHRLAGNALTAARPLSGGEPHHLGALSARRHQDAGRSAITAGVKLFPLLHVPRYLSVTTQANEVY